MPTVESPVREAELADLLGRREASAALADHHGAYAGKRVLITGAAGSVGSALSLHLASGGCSELILLDRYDHGLLDIVEQARRLGSNLSVHDVLCDVRDRRGVSARLMGLAPDIVIHAAALKHVHLGERHPGECVLTNLIAVRNVAAAAAAAGTGTFILVSSDKAASPAGVMGASKRLAELYLGGLDREQPNVMASRAVRFGNVIGSRGSVTPRFAEQIARGGPLEITHPDMQRYFMTPREAVGFILSVAALDDRNIPNAGVYIMDMGSPVSILELARKMMRASGRSVDIAFTGLRPGEKITEELSDAHESAARCPLPGIIRLAPNAPGAYLASADIGRLEALVETMDDARIRESVFALLDTRLSGEAAPLRGACSHTTRETAVSSI